jgi:hypothetical protein
MGWGDLVCHGKVLDDDDLASLEMLIWLDAWHVKSPFQNAS